MRFHVKALLTGLVLAICFLLPLTRAATAASRATAILMIVLPPAVLAFFVYRKPTYLDELMSSTWGRNSTILAVCLEIIGALWVMRILKDSEQS